MTYTEAIRKWRLFLEERMDSDFGLLDNLLADETIDWTELDEVRSESSLRKRNAQLLNYILDKDKSDGLIAALRDANQMHIVNYLTADGEYTDRFGEEWPLTKGEISILSTNRRSLVDILDLTDLLSLLYSSKVINNRQKDSISSKQTSHEKNETLLDILRRRSLRDYRQTIKCLHQSKQSHIAEILEKGGVVLGVHVNLGGENITEDENEIVTRMENLLNDRSIDQSNRILELLHHRVIAGKRGQSVVLYIYCRTIEELEQLYEPLVSGQLKESVDLWFNVLSNLSQKIAVKAISIADEEFEKMRTYFKEKEISPRNVKSRNSDDVGETKIWLNEELEISATEGIKLRAIQDFDPYEIKHREKIKFERFLKNQGLAHFGNDENESQSIDRQGNNDVEPIPFKRGDTMETIHPLTIGDKVGWWKVRHLVCGKTGFIPRNRVVIAANDHQSPSRTTLYDLPLELMDTVLENSFLHWILNCSPQQENEDAIKALMSVDFCWFQRIRRRRFKKRFWQRLKDFYEEIKRGSVVIRNHQNYLLENIQPTEALISSLLSLDCITDEQRRVIQQQRSICIKNAELRRKKYPDGDKNFKLMHFVRSFDQTNLSNAVKCLRQTHPTQKTVARIIKNGGVVIKVEMTSRYATRIPATSMETQKLVHQRFEDLRNRTNPWSHQTDKAMSELNDQGIEILNSQMDRQTVVVWIWCRSQTSLQYLQKLYDSNQLRDVLSGLTNVPPEIMQSTVINVHSNQFMKTVVVFPSSVSLTEIIDVGRDEDVRGVTKLRNEIYVVCESSSDDQNVIYVYEDRNPFRLQRKIEIKEIKIPFDIGSSEKKNCLYISDIREYCIWKITREADDQHKIIKWLETDYKKSSFLVSRDDHILLLFDLSPRCLMVFGSDAKLVEWIPLPSNFKRLWHAVETSTGNFIIIHQSSDSKSTEDEDKEEKSDDEEEEDSHNDYDKKDDDDEEEEDMEEKQKQLNDGRAYIEEKEVKKGKEAEYVKAKNDEREEEKESASRERKSIKHEEEGEEEAHLGERMSSRGNKKVEWCISEVTRDGEMVIRRFIPLNEKQKLIRPCHLSVDSDDRVFVADFVNNRVVLLDSDLKWNRTICETKEENDEEEDKDNEVLRPDCLCYDEEKEQLIVSRLIVSGFRQRGVCVYTLGRI